jgi:hypothetical protein
MMGDYVAWLYIIIFKSVGNCTEQRMERWMDIKQGWRRRQAAISEL